MLLRSLHQLPGQNRKTENKADETEFNDELEFKDDTEPTLR
jgi:hypothetical protein